MPTLSSVKYELKSVSKWAGIVFGLLLALFIIGRIAFAIKEMINPSPPEPPKVAFGKLPHPDFPESASRNFTFTIDTLTGELPALPDKANVHEIKENTPDLLASEKAGEKVAELGFNKKPEQLSDSTFRWTDDSSLTKTLVLNVQSPEFYLSSAYASNPVILSSQNLPTIEEAKALAKSFAVTLSLYPNDADESKTRTELLSIVNGSTTPTTSLAGTHVISVYFLQKNVDRLPIMYPEALKSTMNILVSGGESEPQVVEARFSHQTVDNKSSTYPIRTAQEAYDKLKKGKAYVAGYTGTTSDILIKKVYLGYYMSKVKQKYLMPVIVFEGRDNFFAYVSAVKDEWIGN